MDRKYFKNLRPLFFSNLFWKNRKKRLFVGFYPTFELMRVVRRVTLSQNFKFYAKLNLRKLFFTPPLNYPFTNNMGGKRTLLQPLITCQTKMWYATFSSRWSDLMLNKHSFTGSYFGGGLATFYWPKLNFNQNLNFEGLGVNFQIADFTKYLSVDSHNGLSPFEDKFFLTAPMYASFTRKSFIGEIKRSLNFTAIVGMRVISNSTLAGVSLVKSWDHFLDIRKKSFLSYKRQYILNFIRGFRLTLFCFWNKYLGKSLKFITTSKKIRWFYVYVCGLLFKIFGLYWSNLWLAINRKTLGNRTISCVLFQIRRKWLLFQSKRTRGSTHPKFNTTEFFSRGQLLPPLITQPLLYEEILVFTGLYVFLLKQFSVLSPKKRLLNVLFEFNGLTKTEIKPDCPNFCSVNLEGGAFFIFNRKFFLLGSRDSKTFVRRFATLSSNKSVEGFLYFWKRYGFVDLAGYNREVRVSAKQDKCFKVGVILTKRLDSILLQNRTLFNLDLGLTLDKTSKQFETLLTLTSNAGPDQLCGKDNALPDFSFFWITFGLNREHSLFFSFLNTSDCFRAKSVLPGSIKVFDITDDFDCLDPNLMETFDDALFDNFSSILVSFSAFDQLRLAPITLHRGLFSVGSVGASSFWDLRLLNAEDLFLNEFDVANFNLRAFCDNSKVVVILDDIFALMPLVLFNVNAFFRDFKFKINSKNSVLKRKLKVDLTLFFCL